MKKLLSIICLAAILLVLTGCNKQVFDFEYTFRYAYCDYDNENIPDVIEIDKWNDYDGDQLQIISKDGNTYIVHAARCVLKD